MSTRSVPTKDPSVLFAHRYDELVYTFQVIADGNSPRDVFQSLATQGVTLPVLANENHKYLQTHRCLLWVSEMDFGFHGFNDSGPSIREPSPADGFLVQQSYAQHNTLGRIAMLGMHCPSLNQSQGTTLFCGTQGAFAQNQGLYSSQRANVATDLLGFLKLQSASVNGSVQQNFDIPTYQYLYYVPQNPNSKGIITQNPFGTRLTFRFSYPVVQPIKILDNPGSLRLPGAPVTYPYQTSRNGAGLLYLDDPSLWTRDYPIDPGFETGGTVIADPTSQVNRDPSVAWAFESLKMPMRFLIHVQPVVQPWSSVWPHLK